MTATARSAPGLVVSRRALGALVLLMGATVSAPTAAPPPRPAAPPSADVLRGGYGRYRANNDLLSYHLDLRVDPETRFVRGKNAIRFRMLQTDTRIQLDLHRSLAVDGIFLGKAALAHERVLDAVFVDFPEPLAAGREATIDFSYSGTPLLHGPAGGALTFRRDAAGHPLINTVSEDAGASAWWPCKDQWRDEVEEMRISVSIPSDLVEISNGKFLGKTELGDGHARWDWLVQYPINAYSVSMNIGRYEHFEDRLGDLTLDFHVLPESLEKARRHFEQVKPMLEVYQEIFGAYPFERDGYKLIEATTVGMENQSAVTYGNGFTNGYLGRDWTGTGLGLKLDFAIVHESAHEWFGNAVSAADVSDMWIHEGWATYLECLYVEKRFGRDDALRYIDALRRRVQNLRPVITERGRHQVPPIDMYFKGALFLHTLRSVVNDDPRWWKLLRDLYLRFRHRTVLTEDLTRFMSDELGQDLTPIFDQYLRHAALPTLELTFDEAKGEVSYRWRADEPRFAMPVRAGARGALQLLEPETTAKTLRTSLTKASFEVATELYYLNVARQ